MCSFLLLDGYPHIQHILLLYNLLRLLLTMQETADLCTAGADSGIGTFCKYNDFDCHANQESNRHNYTK